jgi:ABC-2 type transport system ATP-binding protein
VLEALRLHKQWPGGAQVLGGVSLVLPQGQLCVVEGANGAGKSTFVRVIAGILAPDAGEVRVRGRAFAAGDTGLYARLDVPGHLELACGLCLVPRARRRALIAQAVERFELGSFGRRRVDRLSTGQRQRLRLALGFLHEPSLVLLDEPHASLDPAGRTALDRALGAHLAAGRSALWVRPGDDGGPRPHLRLRLSGGRLVPA